MCSEDTIFIHGRLGIRILSSRAESISLRINNTIITVNHRILYILTKSKKRSDCSKLIGNEFQSVVPV